MIHFGEPSRPGSVKIELTTPGRLVIKAGGQHQDKQESQMSRYNLKGSREFASQLLSNGSPVDRSPAIEHHYCALVLVYRYTLVGGSFTAIYWQRQLEKTGRSLSAS